VIMQTGHPQLLTIPPCTMSSAIPGYVSTNLSIQVLGKYLTSTRRGGTYRRPNRLVRTVCAANHTAACHCVFVVSIGLG
jgi:hypothetical protein